MYVKARELIDSLKRRDGTLISFDVLKNEIATKIGGDKNRTIKPYIKLMIDLQMIKERENGIELQ